MTKICRVIIAITITLVLLNCKNSSSQEHSNPQTPIQEKLSISQKLRENSYLPIKEQITLYRKLKEENPDTYNFENEDELTMYGYGYLWNNEVKKAIEIFKLIVEQFPNSANPYDSLAEGYLANGDTLLSLANYEQTLALNPDNFNAEDQIELIKFPKKKKETPTERFVKIFPADAYKEDLEELGKRLVAVHPEVFKFISKEDFWKNIEEKKAMISPNTTYGHFIWLCSDIIARINCSHTSLNGFYQESEMLSKPFVFPLQTRWVNNQLFVVDALNNTKYVNIKDEITSINGTSVAELVPNIYKHIVSQGHIETTKNHFFNSWSTEIIPYALGLPNKFSVKIEGKTKVIDLDKADSFKAPYPDKSLERGDTDLTLELINDDKTALMTIASFNYYPWNNFTVFKDFIDVSFNEIREKGVENLVIDLRFNGGGSSESSIYLLKHLVDKPFTYFTNTEATVGQIPFEKGFRGKLFFMIDCKGESTTGHFMSIIKNLELGTIIGEELGSNQFCTAGQTICRLRNTKLLFYVANSPSRVAVKNLPDDRGIMPDYTITQNINDYLNKVDTVKEFTLKLITK
jgi:C-terminal processing protease CtpA/Prc